MQRKYRHQSYAKRGAKRMGGFKGKSLWSAFPPCCHSVCCGYHGISLSKAIRTFRRQEKKKAIQSGLEDYLNESSYSLEDDISEALDRQAEKDYLDYLDNYYYTMDYYSGLDLYDDFES